jgi:hypothetical protein
VGAATSKVNNYKKYLDDQTAATEGGSGDAGEWRSKNLGQGLELELVE